MPTQKIHLKKILQALGIFFGITIFTVALLLITTFPYRKPLAVSIWKHFHNENLATFLDRNSSVLAFTIGEYYFNHGSYDIAKAESYYTRAITLDAQYLEAYYQRGRVFFIQGKFSRASVDMQTVLRIDPEFKKAHYMLGLINGYSGALDQAIEDFKTFLEWKPSSWAGHNDLVWVYFQKGDYKNAKEVAIKGLVFAPENPWLENALGVALMNLEDLDQAREHFEQALKHANQLTPERWGAAYPGNDPTLYAKGLDTMRASIQKNLDLLIKKGS
ncbi:MAG: tetratricopeptide repeat protein [Candidatus Moranbacteria bacterium]|nr:tetratricopeptide repeat protein [Candidatus Moranbacteria bacterium]